LVAHDETIGENPMTSVFAVQIVVRAAGHDLQGQRRCLLRHREIRTGSRLVTFGLHVDIRDEMASTGAGARVEGDDRLVETGDLAAASSHAPRVRAALDGHGSVREQLTKIREARFIKRLGIQRHQILDVVAGGHSTRLDEATQHLAAEQLERVGSVIQRHEFDRLRSSDRQRHQSLIVTTVAQLDAHEVIGQRRCLRDRRTLARRRGETHVEAPHRRAAQ